MPGELSGYWEAHQKYGKLPWFELFEPTISLCETGSLVNDYLEKYLASKESMIKAESSLAEILINPSTNSVWKVKLAVSITITIYFGRKEIDSRSSHVDFSLGR